MFSPTGIPNTVPNNYLFDGDPATSQSFPASNVVVADLDDNENPFTDVRLIFSSTFPADYPSAATSSVSSNSVAGTGNRRLSKSENVTEVECLRDDPREGCRPGTPPWKAKNLNDWG